MNDDQLELTSAYLDGEATAEERALVESDAELLAEVERLRAVRGALGDVDPPSSAARESAIAAALAEFDERTAAASPAPPSASARARVDATAPTNVVPIERRRRMRRLQGLSAAAAAIVIVGGGIAISQRDDGGDLQNSAQRQDSTPVLEAPAANQPAGTDASADPDAASTTTSNAPMMAVTPTTVVSEELDVAADAVISTENEAAIEPEMASDSATAPGAGAPQATAGPTTAGAPAAAPATTVARRVLVRDEDDLLEFAGSMKTEPIDIDDVEEACDEGTLKADAVFEAEDGTQRSIVVVTIAEDDGVDLAALSLADCEVVLRVERPAD